MTGDEGLHERRAVRASVCRTVCFRGRCSHCINQHIRFITVVCEQILRAFLRTCALLGESDSKPRETVSSTKPCRTYLHVISTGKLCPKACNSQIWGHTKKGRDLISVPGNPETIFQEADLPLSTDQRGRIGNCVIWE